MELQGQCAVVTGSAQGIGKAIAFELAVRGADLALCDLREDELRKTAGEIQAAGSVKVFIRRIDLAQENEIEGFVEEAEKSFGRIDILVNNAGMHPLHRIQEISSSEWDLVLQVNLRAHFLFCRQVLPGMRRRKYGRIINIASEAGKNGGTVAAAHYAASKAGVLGFTRNLAQQTGGDGITVNAVCPGRIATAMASAAGEEENRKFIENSILKRIGDPEDVAFAVAYLASPRAGFVTAESMMVNGGTLRD
ncbi:SDR family NAD(P)-dependent oxidoreductase [Marispirochaeta aestuarii]|nr:SDR family NAD(P)-dependent oxidoreductase [Marispirochaeta aestuarii]